MADSSGSSGSDSGDAYVTVTVTPDPGFELKFDGLVATEELGRPFLITLDVSSGKVKGNIANMLGSSVTIKMNSATDDNPTYFNGYLTRASYAGVVAGTYRYHFELRPWIWLLSRTADCKIFQTQAPFDIISAIFQNNGFSDVQDKRQQSAASTSCDYIVQYRETSLDFVTRLMEDWGLYYFFQHQDGSHNLLICDDPGSHTALTSSIKFASAQTEARAVEDHVSSWTSDLHLQSGKFTYRDYNFTTPSADLTSKNVATSQHPYGDMEIYDYPGAYPDTDTGSKLVAIRMQELTAKQQVFDGVSNARGIRAGVKFTLSNHPDTDMNQEYLVTRAVTTLTMAEGASDTRGQLVDSHRVEFAAIVGTTPFQLERLTPRPVVRGPQTAKVVGESGDEITTDQYGRIKVQFYWDRVGTNDQNSSCWIRVSQPWAGQGWGGIVIPRIGMEVVVEFLEGNPDRPLVTGVVYNATQTVPYTLPDKKVVSTFKTNSSQGGGGSNELRFDDTKGSEEVFFNAQYNYHKVVLNNETVEITQDTDTTVKQGNRKVTVTQGNDDHTVSQGNRSATVSQGNESTTVSAGNHSLSVSAGKSTTTTGQSYEVTASTSISLTGSTSISITANTELTLTCGGSSISITPSSITISSPEITGSASGPMSLTGTPISLN